MKVFIRTLGCEKNTVDSEYAAGILRADGFELCQDPDEADVIMVNTCAFINDAKAESINTVLEYAADKKPGQKLIMSGCLAQRYSSELRKEMPEVDGFVGVNDYAKLPALLRAGSFEPAVSEAGKVYDEEGTRLHESAESPWTASLKIAEGCNNICTFCAIPFIRGRYRSRKPEAVLKEARQLAASGVKEIVVIAQDVTGYGQDLQADWKGMLPDLIRNICRIDGIEWVRLMYCYEDEITQELIDVIKEEPKVCKYLDIPIQHVNSRILKAMNRRSTTESIKATISNLRKQIPGIVIRTTLISGFPGETREEFEELMDFVRETRFDRLGVFAYSKEDGTAAAKMPGQVRKDVKERRRDRIMRLQQGISLENNERYIGRVLRVLTEEMTEPGCYLGRSAMDAPEIDNGVIFTSERELAPGEFTDVLIDDAFDYDLSGKAVL
ncbi:MAG: 30S ribosomal protein S12 methylthiotransferase RimO [Firmicutes bacterium]|nr:30S ribosomal protein S12 methylthiotransferase RimO [Bacillota bacterium]MBQ4370969.1 30S ribosomal protein S12 methylthiotransferase RimO [Bacillota bacterium]